MRHRRPSAGTETFGFGRGTLWSKGREGYCWEPESSEVEVVVVE